MSDGSHNGRSRLLSLASRAVPSNPFSHRDRDRSTSQYSSPDARGSILRDHNNLNNPLESPRGGYGSGYGYGRSPSPSYSDTFSSAHGQMPQEVSYPDDLAPPTVPFIQEDRPRSAAGSGGGGSRRSSFSSDVEQKRPASLSINYVPAKFTKLHAPGEWAHRRAKAGGGRDAFAKDAQRMGQMGTVDDDEGVVFQIGKNGLKRRDKPKLRWNRFKWILFVANGVLFISGMATLVSAILVWLNVFYQSDVIRVGNHTELIISTVGAALIVLTSLIGYAGILLNNRAFLAVYTLLLWVCLGFIAAPGYLTYKQRTFNLEGKINLQWSRNLGTKGRLRIQDALRCCGYYSPYVEATQSALCFPRSILPGCKAKYMHLERRVLEIWYTVAFCMVPSQILIIVASLLCSNHITYRFGKGLTPKRYRLDLSSMAVIMDEYASQIAAQYGPNLARETLNRSSLALPLDSNSPNASRHDLLDPNRDSYASASGADPRMTRAHSRLPASAGTASSNPSGAALFDPRRDSMDATAIARYADADADHYSGDDQHASTGGHSGSGSGDHSHLTPGGQGESRYAQPGWR